MKLHKLRWFLAAGVFLIALVCLPFALQLEVDPSNNSFFEQDEAFEQNLLFQKNFGSDDTIVICVGDTPIFQKNILDWIRDFSDQVITWEGVEGLQSITNVKKIKRNITGVSVGPMSEPLFDEKTTVEGFSDEVFKEPELTRLLLNPERTMAATVVFLKSDLENRARHEIIEKVINKIKAKPIPSGKLYVSGTAIEQDLFISRIQKDSRVFVPLTFIIVILMLIILSGKVHSLLFPSVVIVSTLITTQAIMLAMGFSLNIVTALVSPVILIVSVANGVHVQSFARHVRSLVHPEMCLQRAFETLWPPCLLATLTTMAGFLSLSLNSIPAVRQFGVASAMGVAIAFMWTVILTPLFLNIHVHAHHSSVGKAWRRVSSRLVIWSLRGRKRYLGIGFSVLVIGTVASFWINVETDILSSFKPSDPFRQDTEQIQKHLGGVYTLETMITAPSREAFGDEEQLAMVQKFKEEIKNLPHVSDVWYITDLFQAIDRNIRGEKAEEGVLPPEKWLGRYLEGLEKHGGSDLAHFVADDFKQTRMTIFLTLSNTAGMVKLTKEIIQMGEEMLPPDWSVLVTGQTYLLARMSQRLARGELMSIGAAFFAITVMLIFFMRSVRIGLLSLVVNAIPLAAIFGLMPLFRIPLNTATAMIGGVAVGIIVDSTIHVLYRYKNTHKAATQSDIVRRVMAHCAQPLISSTLILAAGFSVTLFGSTQPTIHFGLLMVVILFLALLANLFVLPSMLTTFGKKRK